MSDGAQTAPAAMPATTGATPSTAAPQTQPVYNTPAVLPSRKTKSYSTKKVGETNKATSSSGISTMLTASSDSGFNEVKHHRTTYKVPCFIMFYYVLHLLDSQMARTKRFTDANADWHPFVSRLYYSVLIYYVVLKNQRLADYISQEQNLFLDYMDSNYKMALYKISGPLTVFFDSLAACAGPDSSYGPIVFAIPNNLTVTQREFFRFQNRIDMHLPNVIVLLDQFMRTLNTLAPINAVPQAANMADTDNYFSNLFGVPSANDADTRFNMLNPAVRFSPEVTVPVLNGLVSTASAWRDVLPFSPGTNTSTYVNGNNQNYLALDQILGFRGYGDTANRNFNWFNEAARIMQPYCDFQRESRTLGSITSTGLGVSYVITRPFPVASTVDFYLPTVTTRVRRYQADANLVRYALPEPGESVTYHVYAEDRFDLVAEQMAMVTQLDIDWRQINDATVGESQGPLRPTIAIGPIEDRLIQFETGPLSTHNAFPALVSGYYHVPTALRFE